MLWPTAINAKWHSYVMIMHTVSLLRTCSTTSTTCSNVGGRTNVLSRASLSFLLFWWMIRIVNGSVCIQHQGKEQISSKMGRRARTDTR